MKYLKSFENFNENNDYEFINEPIKHYEFVGIFDFDNQKVNLYKKNDKYFVHLYVYEVRFTLDSDNSSEIYKINYYYNKYSAEEDFNEDDEPYHNESKYEYIIVNLTRYDSIAEIMEYIDDDIINIDSIYDEAKDTIKNNEIEISERIYPTTFSKNKETLKDISEEAEEYVCEILGKKYLSKYNDLESFKIFKKDEELKLIEDNNLEDKMEEKLRTSVNIRFADHVANPSNYFKFDNPKSSYFISIVSSIDDQSKLGWRFAMNSTPKYYYQFIIDSNSTMEEFKDWFDETFEEIKLDFEDDLETFISDYIK